MRQLSRPDKALRLIEATQQHWVCQSCRRRQFSTSRSLLAELPWYRRMQNAVFGSKEDKTAAQSRKELTAKHIEELRQQPRTGKEVKVDKKTGREYEVASIVDPTIDTDYVAKTTWDDLERIGGEAWVQKRADSGEVFTGFAPQREVDLQDHDWRKLLRHVAVEVLALRQKGLDTTGVCAIDAKPSRTRHARIEDGGRSISGPGSDVDAFLDTIIAAEDALPPKPTRTVLNSIIQSPKTTPDDWMSVEVKDPAIKLAISKRIYQLTGRRVTDFKLSASQTLAQLYDAYKTPAKPKRLHEAPQIMQMEGLSNVAVRTKRVTPMDKDKAVGRWKVIEEELHKRDLPSTGSRLKGAKINLPQLQGRPKKARR